MNFITTMEQPEIGDDLSDSSDEEKTDQGAPTIHELRRRLRMLTADLNALNKTLYHRRPLVIKEAMSVLGTPFTSTMQTS